MRLTNYFVVVRVRFCGHFGLISDRVGVLCVC